MSMHTAFLFPGQGAQTPHFLHALPEHEVVREAFAEAEQTLGLHPNELDSVVALRSTVAVQLATLIAGVAYARVLATRDACPDAVAGLSVGAFTAAVASDALGFSDALRLVRLRAESMERFYGQGAGYGMIAVLGLRQRAVQGLIDRSSRSAAAPLYVASINSPTEIILAGSDSALEEAAEEAARIGARSRRLNVSVPSHGPLLESVSARQRAAMSEIRLNTPRVPYVSNTRARAVYRANEVAEDLALNVSRMVRWHDSVTLLYESGVRVFIEVPPGRTLTALMQDEFPEARVWAAADTELDSIVHVTHSRSS
jgi:malonate decarboxylase epsilon subunit